MTTDRDKHGRWVPGVSGNPKGRPKGAKDKSPLGRFYYRTKPLTHDPTARLGRYAIEGGPGRPKGSIGKKYRVLLTLLNMALINGEKT